MTDTNNDKFWPDSQPAHLAVASKDENDINMCWQYMQLMNDDF